MAFGFLKSLFGGTAGDSGSSGSGSQPQRTPLTLPASVFALAASLEISEEDANFLASGTYRHYVSYRRAKRGGGQRLIDSPKAKMKAAQRQILAKILSQHQPHDRAHGFVKGRSVRSATVPHAGKNLLVTADLSKFFPSIRTGRVYGLFRALGYDEECANFLSRLTTWKGRLPQGAPTSPAIANAIALRLDARYAGLAKKVGAEYTRYADDLAFSGARAFRHELYWVLPMIRRIAIEEGFHLPKENITVIGSGARQKHLGVVVNTVPNLPREERRRLRAAVHQVATGKRVLDLAAKSELLGKISWLRSVNPADAEKLLSGFNR